MKKSILFLCMCASLAATAQLKPSYRFNLIAKAGANYSTWATNQSAKFGFKPGYEFSLTTAAGFGKNFSAQTGVMFLMQEVKNAKKQTINTVARQRRIEGFRSTYLYIPLTVQYTHKTGLFASAGAAYGMLLKAKELEPAFHAQTDATNKFNNNNFTLMIGAGYNITRTVGIGFNYAYGLSDLRKISSIKEQTRVLSLGLHYKWNDHSAR